MGMKKKKKTLKANANPHQIIIYLKTRLEIDLGYF